MEPLEQIELPVPLVVTCINFNIRKVTLRVNISIQVEESIGTGAPVGYVYVDSILYLLSNVLLPYSSTYFKLTVLVRLFLHLHFETPVLLGY